MANKNTTATRDSQRPRLDVGLMVTCLADLFRPSVAFASIALLERAGCRVTVPLQQTCCGQPAYNTGDYAATRPVATAVIEAFENFDYVVVPSGSCAGMLCEHYPKLLKGSWQERAQALAAKTFELSCFLTTIAPPRRRRRRRRELGTVTYHDSCAGLRELGIRNQPRRLLESLCEVTVTEMDQTDVCCGFGGTFCVKMPSISNKMVDDKLEHALATRADILTGGDLGCLMNIAGRARRRGVKLEIRHVAELLAGELDEPAIGEGTS